MGLEGVMIWELHLVVVFSPHSIAQMVECLTNILEFLFSIRVVWMICWMPIKSQLFKTFLNRSVCSSSRNSQNLIVALSPIWIVFVEELSFFRRHTMLLEELLKLSKSFLFSKTMDSHLIVVMSFSRV